MDTASLLWGLLFGSIGFGFFLYGKNQKALVPALVRRGPDDLPVLHLQHAVDGGHRRGADGHSLVRPLLNAPGARSHMTVPNPNLSFTRYASLACLFAIGAGRLQQQRRP